MNTKTTIFGLILIFLILNVLDITTTVYAVKNGFEANPAMAYLQSLDWGLWMAVKLIVGFVIAFAIYRLYKTHVKAARITALFIVVVYIIIAVNNAVLIASAECVYNSGDMTTFLVDSYTKYYPEWTAGYGTSTEISTYEFKIKATDGFPTHIVITNTRQTMYYIKGYTYDSNWNCNVAKNSYYIGISGLVKNTATGEVIGHWTAVQRGKESFEMWITYDRKPYEGETLGLTVEGYWSYEGLCSITTLKDQTPFATYDRSSGHPVMDNIYVQWYGNNYYRLPTIIQGTGGGNFTIQYETFGVTYNYTLAYYDNGLTEFKLNSTKLMNVTVYDVNDEEIGKFYTDEGVSLDTYFDRLVSKIYLYYKGVYLDTLSPAELLTCYPTNESETNGAAPTEVKFYFFDIQTNALLDNVSFSISGDDFSDNGVYDYIVQYTSDQLTQGNTYNYTAERTGYKPVSGSFMFTGGQVIKLYFVPDLTNPNATEHVSDPVNNTALTFTVLDSETKEPVEGATVMVEGYSKLTNANGFTWFEVVKSATYHYTVSKSGYYSISGTINVGENQTDVTVELIPISTTATTTAGAGTGGGTTGGGEDTTQNAVDTLKANAESIVSLCILGTIIGLLRIMTMRR